MQKTNDTIRLSYRTDDLEIAPAKTPAERREGERDIRRRIEAVRNGLAPDDLPPRGLPDEFDA